MPEWCRSRLVVLLVCVCVCVPVRAATTVLIHAIMTGMPGSPYLGQTVTTTGVVIAVLGDGFYLESASGWDADPCTSEGIYVYTPHGVPSNAVVGNSLTVTGVVEDENATAYSGVRLNVASADASTVVTSATNQTLPQTVDSATLTQATSGGCKNYAAGSFGQWLPFEGMRVKVPTSTTLTVVAPTGGTVDAVSGVATSNGQFWAVLSGTRPMRAAGISMLETVPATAPSTVTRWTGNPQLLLVDTTTLGGTAINAAAGMSFAGSDNLVGIVDYHVSQKGYTGLLLSAASAAALTANNTVAATASPTATTGQVALAVNNSEQSLSSLTQAASNWAVKMAQAVTTFEHGPDVVAFNDVAVDAVYSALLQQIVTAGGATYQTCLFADTDGSGLKSGFLYNPATVHLVECDQTLAQSMVSNTATRLFTAPPVVLKVGVPRGGSSDYALTIVNSTFASRQNIDDATLGAAVREQRAEQAEQLSAVIENLQQAGEHVVVAGSFDGFEFNDGYVDVVGATQGAPAAATAVTLAATSVTSPALVTLAATATSRYTRTENGSAEQTEQVLVSSEMAVRATLGYARYGADFPLVERNDTTTAAGVTSHDGLVALLTIPYKTTMTLAAAPTAFEYGATSTLTATVASAGGTPTGTVTFTDNNGTTLGTATLVNGVAQLMTPTTYAVGSYTVTADYGGDASYDSTAATVGVNVEPDPTATSFSTATATIHYGEQMLLNVAVANLASDPAGTATPTGTVTFYADGIQMGTGTVVGGVANCMASGVACATTSLVVGTHTIQAIYTPDATHGSSAATLTLTVETNKTTLVLALVAGTNPSYAGKALTYSVAAEAASGTVTGTVQLSDQNGPLQTATLTNGAASFTLSTLGVGTHQLVAGYGGDGTHTTATSNTVAQQVLPVVSTLSTLSCVPTLASYGTAINCSDQVTAADASVVSGTVTFYDGANAVGTATLTGGVGSWGSTTLGVGQHTLTARYAWQAADLASTSNSVTITILSDFKLTASTPAAIYQGESTTVALSVTPGTGFTLDVALSCAGLPANTTCTLTPASVAGGRGTATLVLKTTAPQRVSGMGWLGFGVSMLTLLLVRRRGRMLLAAALLVTAGLSGCLTTASTTGGTTAGSYTIVVSGVANDGAIVIARSVNVPLVVKSLF